MARYYFDGEEHWLADRRGLATLVLSDVSVWEVADADRAILAKLDSILVDGSLRGRRNAIRLHSR